MERTGGSDRKADPILLLYNSLYNVGVIETEFEEVDAVAQTRKTYRFIVSLGSDGFSRVIENAHFG